MGIIVPCYSSLYKLLPTRLVYKFSFASNLVLRHLKILSPEQFKKIFSPFSYSEKMYRNINSADVKIGAVNRWNVIIGALKALSWL